MNKVSLLNQREKRHHFGVIMLVLLVVSLLCSCGSKRNSKDDASSVLADTQTDDRAAKEAVFTGVLKNIDEDSNLVTVFDIQGKSDTVFHYTGGTDIRDAYDQVVVISQLSLGEIVTVTYQEDTQKLVSLLVSKDAWEYSGVANLSLDKTNYRMTIGDRNYWYEEGLLLFSKDQLIDLIDLNPRDVLKIKGVGSQICSIVVTTGHGYIRLTNYSDFIGGTIEIGYGIILPIVDNMLIVAREGEHRITLENGELAALDSVILERDKEVVLDFSAYHVEAERVGYVRFEIEPYGADLYINGSVVNYSEPIKMNYGKHNIRVTMNGYDDFNGILTIGEFTPTININLVEGTYDVTANDEEDVTAEDKTETKDPAAAEKEPDTKIEPTEEDTTEKDTTENSDNQADEVGTTSIDKEHTITVESPAGASLYLNGTLKGTIPLTFVKEIGNHIFVLSQPEYTTTSYSVEVLDDGENALYNFSDMILAESK